MHERRAEEIGPPSIGRRILRPTGGADRPPRHCVRLARASSCPTPNRYPLVYLRARLLRPPDATMLRLSHPVPASPRLVRLLYNKMPSGLGCKARREGSTGADVCNRERWKGFCHSGRRKLTGAQRRLPTGGMLCDALLVAGTGGLLPNLSQRSVPRDSARRCFAASPADQSASPMREPHRARTRDAPARFRDIHPRHEAPV